MKKSLLLSLITFLSLTAVFGQNQYWEWAQSAGGVNSEYATCTATDAAGNVYVAGSFQSATLVFGATPALTNNGNSDIFVVKYNSSGTAIWSRSLGGSNYESCYGIAVDGPGNVYICGNFASSTITFNTSTLTNGGSFNAFIAKYSASGSPMWAKGASGNGSDQANGITLDNFGHVYITGKFESTTINFGSGAIPNYNANGNVFTAKYDINGNFIWADTQGEEGYDMGKSIAVDNNGNIYVAGNFTSIKMMFGNLTIPNPGGSTIFVTKYDSTGTMTWLNTIGGAANEECGGLILDNLGFAYVTGQFFSSFNYAGTTLSSNGGSDILICKFNTTTFSQPWGRSGGGTSWDAGYALTLDNSNNLYITGEFGSTEAYFGNDTLVNPTTHSTFITKYSSTGNVIWVKGLYTPYFGDGITADNFGNVYRVGAFEPTMVIGTTTLNSSGNGDMFIAKIAQCNIAQPTITAGSSTTFCPGGSVVLTSSAAASYQWSNSAITQSITADTTGNYAVTITDINGCINADTISVNVALPYSNQQLCMVTVDTTINKNKIIWEKTANLGIDTFYVYKKDFSGLYNVIGKVPYDSMSVFVDTVSNPGTHSDWYKISIIDSCSNESNLSPLHKTMLLSASQGAQLGQHNLIWEQYQGFTFNYYRVYRGLTPGSLSLLDSVLFGTTQYNDTAIIMNDVYYLVQIVKTDTCIASSTAKDQTQTYNTSVSNMEEYQILGVDENPNNLFLLNAFPNPFKNSISISYMLPERTQVNIAIYNILQEKVAVVVNTEQSSGNYKIDFLDDNKQLSNGVYYIRAMFNDNITIKKVIKL